MILLFCLQTLTFLISFEGQCCRLQFILSFICTCVIICLLLCDSRVLCLCVFIRFVFSFFHVVINKLPIILIQSEQYTVFRKYHPVDICGILWYVHFILTYVFTYQCKCFVSGFILIALSILKCIFVIKVTILGMCL